MLIPTVKLEDFTFTDSVGITVEEDTAYDQEKILNIYQSSLWFLDDRGNKKLNENIFAQLFRDLNSLTFAHSSWYSAKGKVSVDTLKNDIWQSVVSLNINTNVASLVDRLEKTCEYASMGDSKIFGQEHLVPFANGILDTNTWTFTRDDHTSVLYRLPVKLAMDTVPTPHFESWLRNLFYEEDLPTIQQYLGYCLLPTTAGQKALFLVGEGGVGKSGVGVILDTILGEANMSVPNTRDFLADKFKIAELDNKLTLYDDDLDAAALSETGFYKNLITNQISLTVDRKYGQPFELRPRARLIACCNKMLSSVYDNTEGFWRRLLPIKVRDLQEDFVPDPLFYDKLRAEKEGILQWMVTGLIQLKKNRWKLPVSSRSEQFLTDKNAVDNPLPYFLREVFDFTQDDTAGVSSTRISQLYREWCNRNEIEKPASSKFIVNYLNDNSTKLNITYSHHIIENGTHVRGFRGIQEKDPNKKDDDPFFWYDENGHVWIKTVTDIDLD